MRKAILISSIVFAVFLMCIPAEARSSRKSRTPKKVVIGFKESAGPQTPESRRSIIRQHGGRARRAYRNLSVVSAELTDTQIASIKTNPNVAYVEEDGLLYALDDELDASWGVSRIGAGEVHALENKGKGVKVAVIDTGIDYTHIDLDDNYAGGYDFVNDDDDPMDDHGHGTHCAGIIAAEDNDTGVVGVAPEASLYAIKTLGFDGSGYLSDVAAGIDWAIENEIDIISLSLGTNNDYQTMRDACNRADEAGIIVVAAAGNDFRRVRNREWDTVDYPARYDTVIAVGAIDDTDTKAYFSSTGSTIELAAPGLYIYSTDIGGIYSYKSGTSMSCPHVVGVAALILSGPGGDVRTVLRDTAEDIGTTGWDTWYGYGLVDAFAAAGIAPEPPVLTTIEITPGSPTLFLGETQQFTATGKDQYGDPIATGDITWEISNTDVGTIDPISGLFESVGLGETTITATGDGDVFGTADVLVLAIPVLDTIDVTPESATLFVDNTQQFTATGTDQYGESIDTGTITWESSNTDVGTIDPISGLFTAVGLGETTITATGNDDIKGTATVSVVVDPVLTTIEIDPANVTLYANEQQQFIATGKDQYGELIDTGDLTWVSDDKTVGTIDENGLFTAVGDGEATIQATGDGNVSGTVIVVVEEEPAAPDEFTFNGIISANQELRHTLSVSGPALMVANLSWYNWGDLRLRLYDPDGTMVIEADSSFWRNQEEEITINVTEGDWQIAVKSDARRWPISYTIEGTLSYTQ